MHPIMQHLNDDHRHMAKVLHCLKHRLNQPSSASNSASDLWLFLAALDYIQVYPERWHHPAEDLIFKRLKMRNPDFASQVAIIEEEHEHMESMTNAMLELCNAFMEDNEQAIKSMRLIMLCFLDLQQKHMQRENEHLYPFIEQHLSAEDWLEIESAIPKIDDPVFGEAVKHNYEKMYEEIIAIGATV